MCQFDVSLGRGELSEVGNRPRHMAAHDHCGDEADVPRRDRSAPAEVARRDGLTGAIGGDGVGVRVERHPVGEVVLDCRDGRSVVVVEHHELVEHADGPAAVGPSGDVEVASGWGAATGRGGRAHPFDRFGRPQLVSVPGDVRADPSSVGACRVGQFVDQRGERGGAIACGPDDRRGRVDHLGQAGVQVVEDDLVVEVGRKHAGRGFGEQVGVQALDRTGGAIGRRRPWGPVSPGRRAPLGSGCAPPG